MVCVCVFTVCVCSLLCVCTLDGLNAEHKFRVWVTSLSLMLDHTDIKLKASYLEFEWGEGEGFLIVVNG